MGIILLFFRIFFIGICALVMVAQTRMVLGMPLHPGLVDGFIFGGSLFGYHFMHPNWRYKATAWGFGVLGGLCFLAWVPSATEFLVSVIPMFFWLAYYGFRRPGNAGLRAGILAKPLTVALAWAWVTVFLPVPLESWASTWPIFLARASFVFALALAYDLSDIAYDRRVGLATLAIKLEEKGTFLLIYQGLGASGLFVSLGFALGVYDFMAAVSLLCSLVFSAWWIRFLIEKEAWQPWHKVLIDALMLLQCCLVLLLR